MTSFEQKRPKNISTDSFFSSTSEKNKNIFVKSLKMVAPELGQLKFKSETFGGKTERLLSLSCPSLQKATERMFFGNYV